MDRNIPRFYWRVTKIEYQTSKLNLQISKYANAIEVSTMYNE